MINHTRVYSVKTKKFEAILLFLLQDQEDSNGSVESQAVRQKIREALENGVRRMNLNTSSSRAETRRSLTSKRIVEPRKPAAGANSARTLTTTLKNIDRLQRDIENSFRDAKSQLEDSQGKKVDYCVQLRHMLYILIHNIYTYDDLLPLTTPFTIFVHWS